MNFWGQISRRLKSEISQENYENWLDPIRFSHIDSERTMHLLAPSESACRWIEEEHKDRILAIARSLALAVDAIEFRAENQAPRTSSSKEPSHQQTRFDFGSVECLNPDYTFNNFVTGPCNQFVHAAAKAVAATPARSYNPLYIYGGVGMGKTHLLHAIGRQLQCSFREFRVVYVPSEQFLNEMVNSIRCNSTASFRDRFRTPDALLIDDIQSLQGKNGVQTELFHTFNVLHSMRKQIVIAGDRPPKLSSGLAARLRSRFEWGLIADIQPLDVATKTAILDRKAANSQICLPKDVRSFLTARMRSDIRELEGVLIRLTALSSLTGEKISLAMARETLRSIGVAAQSQVTLDAILQAVAKEFDLNPAQLRRKTNARSITLPRQVAMYLCRELTSSSLPEIGRSLGGRHHTTVLHSLKKISNLRCTDPELDRLISRLTDRFK